MLREDRRIRVKGQLFGILPCDTAITIHFPGGDISEIFSVSIGPNSAKCLKGGANEKAVAGGIFENAMHFVNRINAQGRNVLLITNLGMWYNDEDKFEIVLPHVFEWMRNISRVPDRKNVVAWQESVSQHWINPIGTGYFHKPSADHQENTLWVNVTNIPIDQYNIPTCCAHITNTSHMADWRNDLARVYWSSREDWKRSIHYLPLVEITRPVADLHTCNPLYHHDCTHYCFTPLIWQPFWFQMKSLSRLTG